MLKPLKEEFPNLTAVEILKKIGTKDIAGLWLRESHHKKAATQFGNESWASGILKEFDKERNSDYAFCKRFD